MHKRQDSIIEKLRGDISLPHYSPTIEFPPDVRAKRLKIHQQQKRKRRYIPKAKISKKVDPTKWFQPQIKKWRQQKKIEAYHERENTFIEGILNDTKREEEDKRAPENMDMNMKRKEEEEAFVETQDYRRPQKNGSLKNHLYNTFDFGVAKKTTLAYKKNNKAIIKVDTTGKIEKPHSLTTLSSSYRRVPQHVNLESVIDASHEVEQELYGETMPKGGTTIRSHQGIQMQGYVSEPDLRGHLFQMCIPLPLKPSIHYHTPQRMHPLTIFTEYLLHSLNLPFEKEKDPTIKKLINQCVLLNVEDMKGTFQTQFQHVYDQTKVVYQRQTGYLPDVLSNADKRQLKNKLIDYELKANACRRAKKRLDQSIAGFNAAVTTESLQHYKKAIGMYRKLVATAQKYNDRVMECIALNHIGTLSMVMYLQKKYGDNTPPPRKAHAAVKSTSRKSTPVVGSPHHHNMLPNGKIINEASLHPTARKQLPSIMRQQGENTITMSPRTKGETAIRLKSYHHPDAPKPNYITLETPSNEAALQELLAQASRYHEVHLVVADLYGKTIASTNLGLVHMMEGNWSDAIARFTEAIRTSQATRQHDIEKLIIPNLALALMVSRYFQEALYLLRVWLHMSNDHPFHFAIIFLLLGRMAQEVDMTKEAFKYFEEAQLKARQLGPIGANILTMCNHYVTKTKTDLLMETHFEKHQQFPMPLSNLTTTTTTTKNMSIKPDVVKTPLVINPWDD